VTLCLTVDDVCLEPFSSEADLERLLGFLEQERVLATFFVVPYAERRPLREQPAYRRLLEAALERGHEVAQHGFEHDRFEVGIPPRMILDLPHEGPARERLRERRREIEQAHSLHNIRRLLRSGREALEQALGRRVCGFRSPALQESPNLFRALTAEGYEYDSSRFLQEAGWDILNRKLPVVPRRIDREAFRACQPAGGPPELPLTTEYTWYLREDTYQTCLDLALHDAGACAAAGLPFIPICHVSPVQQGDPGTGFRLYRELLARCRQAGPGSGEGFRSMTLHQCATMMRSGEASLSGGLTEEARS